MAEDNFFGGIKLIGLEPFSDERGIFTELYNKKVFQNFDIECDFVQDNLSESINKNTMRGLHFQNPPYEQAKLVKVISGSIYDVFIDLREKSENFERCGSYILSEDDGFLLIPKGFAHGFLTLTDNTKVLYKVDNYYNKEHERGIRWNDPFFNINWPTENNVVVSKKDSNLPYWEEIKDKIKF